MTTKTLSTVERDRLLGLRRANRDAFVIDFSPCSGICWSCGTDLVEYFGDKYETVWISGCPKCHRSYCD